MITVRLIVQTVATAYELDTAEVASRRRDRRILWPRQVSIYLARRYTDRSLAEIARAMGGWDHTTLIHARTRVAKVIATDPVRAAEVAQIAEAVKALAIDRALVAAAPHLSDIDAAEVAMRVLSTPGAAAAISIDEIRALAAAVISFEDDLKGASNER